MPAKHQQRVEDTNDGPTLMLIRYQKAYYQPTKNSLNRTCPIHNNYMGTVIGVSEQVECLEGSKWPRNVACAVIWFPSMQAAQQWYDCTPEVKQPDWLHGVDIIAVPMTPGAGKPQQGRGIIQLLDMEFVNKEAFLDEYVSQAEPYLRRFDASPAMVSTCKNRKFRGLWEPGHIVVNWWANPEQFWSAYQSDEYYPLKTKRQATANSDVVIFSLEALETARLR